MKKQIDINCDMGEGFGRWRIGNTDDADLFPFISSANVAAGFHAGDPQLINQTIALAVKHGCAVGAHPGYNDLQGFGRRKINGSADEIACDLIYQIGAVREFASLHGNKLQHVKPHGAVYMELATNVELASTFLDYLSRSNGDLPLYCMGGSVIEKLAVERGQPVVREFYADRDYGDEGFIVFTRDAGAPDPEEIAKKCLRACLEGKVRTVTGNDIDITFESICIHSDTLGSGEIIKAIRKAFEDNNISVRAFA